MKTKKKIIKTSKNVQNKSVVLPVLINENNRIYITTFDGPYTGSRSLLNLVHPHIGTGL